MPESILQCSYIYFKWEWKALYLWGFCYFATYKRGLWLAEIQTENLWLGAENAISLAFLILFSNSLLYHVHNPCKILLTILWHLYALYMLFFYIYYFVCFVYIFKFNFTLQSFFYITNGILNPFTLYIFVLSFFYINIWAAIFRY